MIFFSRQWNPLLFDWDFIWFIKCHLVFKNQQILTDSFVQRISWDFLVKNTLERLFQQSHQKPWDFFKLSKTFLLCFHSSSSLYQNFSFSFLSSLACQIWFLQVFFLNKFCNFLLDSTLSLFLVLFRSLV